MHRRLEGVLYLLVSIVFLFAYRGQGQEDACETITQHNAAAAAATARQYSVYFNQYVPNNTTLLLTNGASYTVDNAPTSLSTTVVFIAFTEANAAGLTQYDQPVYITTSGTDGQSRRVSAIVDIGSPQSTSPAPVTFVTVVVYSNLALSNSEETLALLVQVGGSVTAINVPDHLVIPAQYMASTGYIEIEEIVTIAQPGVPTASIQVTENVAVPVKFSATEPESALSLDTITVNEAAEASSPVPTIVGLSS